MSDSITPELFSHLVDLGALELSEDEADYLRAELNKQLKAIDELAAIPVEESTPIISHGVPYAEAIRPHLRADDWDPSKIAADILAQAPETDEDFIVVPDIPHEELE